MNKQCTAAIARLQTRWGEKFRMPDGAETFGEHYGYRIEVQDPADGQTLRGYVVLTTGWHPSFMLLARRDSIGSLHLIDSRYKVLQRLPNPPLDR